MTTLRKPAFLGGRKFCGRLVATPVGGPGPCGAAQADPVTRLDLAGAVSLLESPAAV